MTPDREERTNITVGVIIPLLQSIVTGFITALVTLAFCAAWGFRPWIPSLIVGTLSIAVSWAVLVMRWVNVVHFIESASGWDINQDGYVGDPSDNYDYEDEPESFSITYYDSPNHAQRVTFPVPGIKIHRMARRLHSGRSFTEQDLTGMGNPLSQRELRQIRNALIDVGWASWVNAEYPKQGTLLSPVAREVFDEISEMHSSLLDREEVVLRGY